MDESTDPSSKLTLDAPTKAECQTATGGYLHRLKIVPFGGAAVCYNTLIHTAVNPMYHVSPVSGAVRNVARLMLSFSQTKRYVILAQRPS